MAKVELKTKKNKASVKEFLESIEDEEKRKECKEVSRMMRSATGKNPKMWGDSIVGFDEYTYKGASGREGDWMRMGFAPRKSTITIYIMDGFEKYNELMEKLGKYKTGKSCLYIKKLDDVDRNILTELMEGSVKHFNDKYGKN